MLRYVRDGVNIHSGLHRSALSLSLFSLSAKESALAMVSTALTQIITLRFVFSYLKILFLKRPFLIPLDPSNPWNLDQEPNANQQMADLKVAAPALLPLATQSGAASTGVPQYVCLAYHPRSYPLILSFSPRLQACSICLSAFIIMLVIHS